MDFKEKPQPVPRVEEIARQIANSIIGPLLHAANNGKKISLNFLDEVALETEAVLRPYFPQTPDKITNDLCEIGRRVLNCLEKHRCPDGAIDEIESSMANLDRVIRKLRSSEPATPASTARTDEPKYKHKANCLWATPLPTGAGFWGCDCGLDKLLLDLEDYEVAAPGVPQAGITTAGEMRARIAAATEEEMQPLRDALRIAVDHFGSDDLEQDTGVPQEEPPKEEKL